MTPPLRVRRSLEDLQDEYTSGNRKPLEDLIRAWKGIQELPPSDPRSFFVLGGYHGEPFRGAGWGSSAYWGGYCNHGNVLFPTWHRVYLYQLEEALRSIPGCGDVTLPFWDETSPRSLAAGIPWALTQQTFELDGETIPNPLCSFEFPLTVANPPMSWPRPVRAAAAMKSCAGSAHLLGLRTGGTGAACVAWCVRAALFSCTDYGSLLRGADYVNNRRDACRNG